MALHQPANTLVIASREERGERFEFVEVPTRGRGCVVVPRVIMACSHGEFPLSDGDIDRNPAILNAMDYPTLIISTHNEYWSEAMVSALRSYERQGGNVISLSGKKIRSTWVATTSAV